MIIIPQSIVLAIWCMIRGNGIFTTAKEFVFERGSVRLRKMSQQINILVTRCMILKNGAIKMHCELFS